LSFISSVKYPLFNRLKVDTVQRTSASDRYERNEVSPSIEVAKKIADALEVSLDYLAGDGQHAHFDKQTLKLINEIEQLDSGIKEKLIFLANAVIRDFKLTQLAKS
jgi:transcriptional regulator with XRE-family HTH domain